jgi:hypothetical protein
MRQNTTLVATLLVACVNWCSATDPDGLVQVKHQFAQLPDPTEADRQNYLLELSKLRESLAHNAGSEDCFKVDEEIRRHSAPEDTKGYTKLMVGKWRSPRHEYIYRADGTWSMLPEEEGTTRGRWRIEGNRFMSSADIEPADTRTYTIILLTKDNLIFTDGKTIFYEERLSD